MPLETKIEDLEYQRGRERFHNQGNYTDCKTIAEKDGYLDAKNSWAWFMSDMMTHYTGDIEQWII